jgi:hypothetical protein
MRHNDPGLTGTVSHDSLLYISTYPVGKMAIVMHLSMSSSNGGSAGMHGQLTTN